MRQPGSGGVPRRCSRRQVCHPSWSRYGRHGASAASLPSSPAAPLGTKGPWRWRRRWWDAHGSGSAPSSDRKAGSGGRDGAPGWSPSTKRNRGASPYPDVGHVPMRPWCHARCCGGVCDHCHAELPPSARLVTWCHCADRHRHDCPRGFRDSSDTRRAASGRSCWVVEAALSMPGRCSGRVPRPMDPCPVRSSFGRSAVWHLGYVGHVRCVSSRPAGRNRRCRYGCCAGRGVPDPADDGRSPAGPVGPCRCRPVRGHRRAPGGVGNSGSASAPRGRTRASGRPVSHVPGQC